MSHDRLPSAEELADDLDAFFGEAFARGRGKEGITPDTLRELFVRHVRISRDALLALLAQAEAEPSALQALAESLKRAADNAHPAITSDIEATDVLAYVLNTMADAFAIAMTQRLTVRLPERMADHGDSLFAFQAKHA